MADENKLNILDLDDFLPDEKTVVIKKKEYKVSGSASVKTTLALMKSTTKWEKDSTSAESIEGLMSSIQEFFITPIEKEVLQELDLSGQLPKLIAFLFGMSANKNAKEGNDEKNGNSQAEKQ